MEIENARKGFRSSDRLLFRGKVGHIGQATVTLPAFRRLILRRRLPVLKFCGSIRFKTWLVNKLEQLRKNCVMVCHGLILLLCWWVMRKTTLLQKEISGLFSVT